MGQVIDRQLEVAVFGHRVPGSVQELSDGASQVNLVATELLEQIVHERTILPQERCHVREIYLQRGALVCLQLFGLQEVVADCLARVISAGGIVVVIWVFGVELEAK